MVKRLTSGLSGAMSSGNLASYIEESDCFRRESQTNINYLEQNTVPHPKNPMDRNMFHFGKNVEIVKDTTPEEEEKK
jgi:hypothetical protein